MKIVHDAAMVVRGFGPDDDFSYTVEETPEVSGGDPPVDSGFYDVTHQTVSASGIINNCRITVADSLTISGHSFSSATPATASVDSAGNVSWVSNGAAAIDIITPVGTKRLTRTMSNSETSTLSYKEHKFGSVGAHIRAAIDALISGQTPGSVAQKLTTTNNYNTVSPAVTRNASLFAGALDLSAISLIRSDRSDEAFPAMLISPRHIIAATHILGAVGTTYVWKASDNSYKSASIVSKVATESDLSIAYLSASIAGINPLKLLPTNYKNYFASLNPTTTDARWLVQRLPCLIKAYHPDTTSSYKSAITLAELYWLYEYDNPYTYGQEANIHSTSASVAAAYSTWTSGTGIRGGDSGSPIMLPINGDAVLVSAFHTGGGGGNWAAYADWIETNMIALAVAQGDNTAYSLLRADLSGFTAYPTV